MRENETFITVKDQKDRFPHRVLCRLLNTSKTNIAKISKVLLDKTISTVFSSIKINQWKNTSPIITRFEKITHKQTSSFICFDVENFYLFISSNLFKESIEFVRQFIQISDGDLLIIMQATKTLFLKVQHTGLKKEVIRISTFEWIVSMALKYAS